MKLSKRFGLSFESGLSKVTHTNKHLKASLGAADWQDAIIAGNRQHSIPEATISPWRRIAFAAIIIVALFGIFLRLFHLQITNGKEYRSLADSNRIQVRLIHAPRGVIYDRHGQILAQNEPGFRLRDATGSAKTRYLSREAALQMEVDNDPRLSDLEIDNLRSYPDKEVTAHILGYVSEITAEELEDPEYKGYHPGDRIGRGGVEQIYEKTLRGVDGGEVIEVDATGKKIRTLGKTDPLPGQNVYLGIDKDLQKVAYEQLQKGLLASKSCCGTAIAEDPQTGEILALASIPSYDPQNLEAAISNPNFPFLNRAIAGTYPPGSTFKIATALSGLESGKITPQTAFEDTGVMSIGPYTYANWFFTQYGSKEQGPVDVVRALQRSNDIFFYHLGQNVGEVDMGNGAKQLGFAKKLGIDLPGEVAGLIPTDEWKQLNFDQPWYPGDSLHMAIGQGYVLVTPLQVSNLISIIAAGGKQYPPHLALKITNSNDRTLKTYQFDPANVGFNPADIRLIQSGLELVPKAGGTAWPFFNFPIATAGKTGTAEFGGADKTHAWYTSYAPVDNPKLAITVLVEGGGEGSTTASPIAREIYRYYFSPDKKNLIKDINQPASASARPIGE